MSDELDQARASIEHLRGDFAKLRVERDLLAESLEHYGECAYNCDCGDHAGPRSCGCHVTGEEARTWIRQQADEIDALSWLHAEAVWQRDQFRANEVENAELANDIFMAAGSKLASAVVLPEDWRQRLGECESSGAAVDLVESWLPAAVEDAPTTPDVPSERYVDVHHLVEAEIQIARLTKDSAGRPTQHDVTRVALAVASAFDMDLTREAEAACRPAAVLSARGETGMEASE